MRNLISHKVLVACGIFGVAFLIIGTLVSYKFIPDIINSKMWEAKVIKNGTDQMEMFMKMPFPFKFKVWLFNVENPNDVYEGAKPILKEVGPYVYNLFRWKENVVWNATTKEISYNEYERYEFDGAASGALTDDDFITIINVPVNSFLMTAEQMSPDALETISDALPGIFGNNSEMFLKTKVKDFLFDGITFCKNRGKDGGFASQMICSQIISKLNTTKSMRLIDNAVSFANFRHKNFTSPGISTIKSGNSVREDTGLLTLHNNKQFIDAWPDENSTCNKIGGITTVFPINPNQKMTFDSFNADICRVMTMSYRSDESIKGLKGLKYVTYNNSFWSLPNTSNHCFCLNTSKNLDGTMGCLNDGLMDMSPCIGGPVLLSFPHLLHADLKYRDSVDGLHPDEKIHETYVVLEVNSGTPLELAKRVQFNMFLRPIEGVSMLENVTNSVVPIMWIEESYTLEDRYVDQLKNSLLKVLDILGIIRWVILIVGGISIILPFFCLIYMD